MHLTPEVALDFVEERLHEDQKAFWYRHLELCKECTAEVSRWRQLEAALRRTHLKSAPKESVETAVNIMSPKPFESGPAIRSILASIIFDSFLEPALAGVRGAAATARQMVMRAEEFDIHIKIWGEPEHRQMLGQLLSRSGLYFVESANFHLMQHGHRLETAASDETGEFHFTDVPEGDLSLQIDLPHLTVIGALKFRETH